MIIKRNFSLNKLIDSQNNGIIKVAYTIDSEEKIEQEQKSLLHINDAFKKIIIVKDSIRPHYNKYGVYIIGLYDFLLNDKSLLD